MNILLTILLLLYEYKIIFSTKDKYFINYHEYAFMLQAIRVYLSCLLVYKPVQSITTEVPGLVVPYI